MHLDLEAVGMAERVIFKVAEALPAAAQLISLHLSFNEGVTNAAIEAIQTSLKVPEIEKTVVFKPFSLLRGINERGSTLEK